MMIENCSFKKLDDKIFEQLPKLFLSIAWDYKNQEIFLRIQYL